MSSTFEKNKSLLLFLVLNTIFLSVSGRHDEHEHLHDFHKYHLGFGVAGAHIKSTNGISPGFHIHLLRQLGEEKNGESGWVTKLLLKKICTTD